jgi:hypothetical protein
MHPLTVHIITRDAAGNREIQQEYVSRSRFPRWELLKIFFHAIVHMRFG